MLIAEFLMIMVMAITHKYGLELTHSDDLIAFEVLFDRFGVIACREDILFPS
jgi:hypothetical protein